MKQTWHMMTSALQMYYTRGSTARHNTLHMHYTASDMYACSTDIPHMYYIYICYRCTKQAAHDAISRGAHVVIHAGAAHVAIARGAHDAMQGLHMIGCHAGAVHDVMHSCT